MFYINNVKKNFVISLLLLSILVLLFIGCTSVKSDADKYVGIYLDNDVNEPNLIIEKISDNNYTVKIGIYRLIDLDDNNATLTNDGIAFNSIDPAGQSIKGIIIVDGDDAVVRFTDSTWGYIDNGDEYMYNRKK